MRRSLRLGLTLLLSALLALAFAPADAATRSKADPAHDSYLGARYDIRRFSANYGRNSTTVRFTMAVKRPRGRVVLTAYALGHNGNESRYFVLIKSNDGVHVQVWHGTNEAYGRYPMERCTGKRAWWNKQLGIAGIVVPDKCMSQEDSVLDFGGDASSEAFSQDPPDFVHLGNVQYD